MKLIGTLIKGNNILKQEYVNINDNNSPYVDLLEKCFIILCKKLEISVPMWLNKNTKEYAKYKRTAFSIDQFIEKPLFDRFEIKVENK